MTESVTRLRKECEDGLPSFLQGTFTRLLAAIETSGYEWGYNDGYGDGNRDGYDEGHADGCDEGYEDGYDDAKKERGVD